MSIEYISQQAKEDLEKELIFLIKEKRREISGRLEESSSLGDLSENSEYHQAKEDQLFNEQKIAELEYLLSRAVVIEQKEKSRTNVEVGCFVVLEKQEKEEFIQCRYQIVGSEEADPFLKKISNKSPLGLALLGKKKKQTAKVFTPTGEVEYTIIEII